MTATLWIDVEDLFEYALHYRRPSGIQRLAFQLYCSLQSRYGDAGLIRFVRHDTARNTFHIVPWSEVSAAFDHLAVASAPRRTAAKTGPAYTRQRQAMRGLVHRLPPAVRAALIGAFRSQGLAFRDWWRLGRAIARHCSLMVTSLGTRTAGETDFAKTAAPGDVVLALGAPWSHPDYANLVRIHRERLRLRFGLLVHDISALRRPEWFDRGLTTSFRRCFNELLPQCDALFAISRYTAADVTAYASELGLELSSPVTTLPIATLLPGEIGRVGSTERLPPAGSYVLFVSTIEPRKNHMLLFRLWRRMLEEMPRDRVPTLVFAGRIGWLVQDLMQQIINADYLSGRLVVLENASDDELAALYRGCLFTVYPSLFEGWGLPIIESLAFGKPCLASDRTSLPEAGGNLARYADPDDLNAWYAAIRQLVEHPGRLALWEERIRREFKPVDWSATIDALLAGLRHLSAQPSPPASSDHVPALAGSCRASS